MQDIWQLLYNRETKTFSYRSLSTGEIVSAEEFDKRRRQK